MRNLGFIKGLVHPKMKISLWFTHPRGILGAYDFQMNPIGVTLKIKMAIPSIIIAAGGCFCSTVQNTWKTRQIKHAHP